MVAAYALQDGCSVNEKDQFWLHLADYTSTIPKESPLLGADLNEHVDKIREGASGCHGDHGYAKGEEFLNFQKPMAF